MKFGGTAFLLVLLSVIANAARTTKYSNPCSTTCSSSPDSLFEPGQAYIYSYEGESNFKTTKGLYDSTGVLIKAKVKITAMSNCEMKLSMSDVMVFDKVSTDKKSFQESPKSSKIKEILEKNEVFFTRQDEKVKSICMNEDEPTWSENLKKVLIDSLANNGAQTKKYERQMTSHGNCFITNKTTDISSSTKSIDFGYDLRNCDNPKMPKSIFTDVTKAALFEVSQVNCHYLYHGETELKDIKCKEEYKMIPLKQGRNQIVVEITTTLTKEKQIQSKDPEFSNKNVIETGIEQSQDEIQQDESTYALVKQTLKEICTYKEDPMNSKIPRFFIKLITQLKDLNSKEFKEIYLDILKTDICPGQQSRMRSIFYDAVGFVNTPAATSVMVDLIKSNKLSNLDQNVWLTSLSFMQQTPTIEMLRDLETLISTENPTSPMYLGISAVTHLYCQHNFQSCLSDLTIKNIISKFLKNLHNDCSLSKDGDKDQLSKIQISLKALGNLKFFGDQVTDVLKRCVSTKTNPLSIRISALEVMKHMDCQKDRSVAMDILENNENDSELRINAYLTVMGCPDINTLSKVRQILAKEKVNQVGSFIWTHLTNIKESSDDLKQKIRELLANTELKKEFDISKLKFSRNIEKTFRAGDLGMTFDSNVIFSEKSFIPRSVSLNTTASILNNNINFIEMSARLEGLEDLLFKLFGPQGYMKKKASIEDNLALINLLNEMNGNMNIKLYGQQISFIELIRGSLGSVKKYNIIEEIISWSRNKQFELNKNVPIVDKTAVIQTMLGFPLQLTLQGAASVNIKIQSKIDFDALFRWPIGFNIDNHISPSVFAHLNADVVLQAPFAKYGMGMDLLSGTNTEVKVKIFTNKNEEFSIKVDTPNKDQNIFSIEGNNYIIHRSNYIVQLSDKMKDYKLCTPKEPIERILGLSFCIQSRFIDPALKKDVLLYEPFAANIFIKRKDGQTGYIIKGSFKSVPFISESGQEFTNRFIKFEFDTPNSYYYNRRFYGEFALDFKEKHIKLDLQTPFFQFLMMTNFKLTENEKKLRVNLQINRKDIIDIMAEHLQFSTLKGNMIRCGITVSVMNFTPIKAKWSLESSNEQWKFNFLSEGLLKDNTQVKIKIDKVKSTRELSLFNKYHVSGFYNSYFGNGIISGIASENYYGHRWDVKLSHKPRDKTRNEFMFIFRHKTEDKSSKNLNKYVLTTTFAYGKNGENILKLRTENELSDKHIRASIRVSSGINMASVSDLVDLQLYGGYRWNKDNRHHAEGSLSVKLPTKNINYEGRYNSEVGKKLFKLSLAFDKDQQSKLNLKINYLQPKLYLKNTDCEVSFSIPNCNVDMKWSLVETDVNKYKYSLEAKYNNYDMRFDGVQTQISPFNHDSFVTIKMPMIEGLPKQMNINLKINLVDLEKANIQGKVEIPNSLYSYSIDTQFSYTPQNLFQLSATDSNSVFKYNIELSSPGRITKSKFIFTCNPEEFQTYFNLNLNTLKNSDNQIEFDVHSVHKSLNHKQFDNLARLTLRYPGNYHSIGFKSEFKFTEMMAQIDLTWNTNQRISIHTMYEIDNSWTQKGLTSSLTIKTPFKGFEQIHFGINAVGQLRYRKIDFECKWGSNKKILFDIVIHPKSSNEFSLDWKLVTPFHGLNLVSFHSKHSHTSNSISTQANLEIGPKRRYQIKFEAINNSEDKNRDYLANVLIESGLYPTFKMSFVHKDDSVHFKSRFDVSWMKSESLNVISDVSYTLEDSEFITKGNIELHSTLKAAKQMKATWSIDNRNGQFQNNIEISYNSRNVLQSSIKGFYEFEPGTIKVEFTGLATVMNGKTLKIANNLNYQSIDDLQNQFSMSQDARDLYSHNIVFLRESSKLKFLIPSTVFKTIDIGWARKLNGQAQTDQEFLKIGEKYLYKLDSVYTKKMVENDGVQIDFKLKAYTDFTKIKEFEQEGKVSINKGQIKYESTTTSEGVTVCKIIVKGEYRDRRQKLHILIDSKYELLNQFNLDFINDRKDKDRLVVTNLGITLNEFTKLNSKISFQDFQLIDIDISAKLRGFYKFFKLKHSHNFITYEDLFDTNIFGKRIRFVSSIQSRGGFAAQFRLNGDFHFLKSFEAFARYSKEGDITLSFQPQRDSRNNEKFKIHYSNLKGIHKLNIDTTSYFQTEMILDTKQFKNMLFEVRSPPNADKPKVRIQFKYEVSKDPMKHHNELKLNLGNYEFELQNKVENVNWKYFLIESEMKTNHQWLRNYKIGFEYQLKPSKLIMNVKTIFNDHFVKLTSDIDSSYESKIGLKMESSFPVLKEVAFELKQKQNNFYKQMSHRSKVVIRSHESVFKFENDIEWSGMNYLKVDLSISGQLSDNEFLIRPKSLKFVHNFYKKMLKEDLQILFSTDTILKVKLQVPLQTKSRSSFELESSFQKLKKLSIDFEINFSEIEEKSFSLRIRKNNDKLFDWESKYKNQNKILSISTDFEYSDTYKTGLEIESTETPFGTRMLKGKLSNSLLKESIVLFAKYDSPKADLSIDLTGAVQQQVSLRMRLSNDQYVCNVRYGNKVFLFDTGFSKIEGFKHIKLTSSMAIEINFELLRSSNSYKASGKVGKHSFQIIYRHKKELDFKFDILNVEMSANVKEIASLNDRKYVLAGKSNIKGWKRFETEVKLFSDSLRNKLEASFTKEEKEIIKLRIENEISRFFTIKYSSIYEILQSGHLEFNYEHLPRKLKLAMEIKSLGVRSLNMEYKLENNKISGHLKSSFDWFRDITVQGQLTNKNNKIKGEVLIRHEKLEKPITGEFSLQIKSNLFKLDLKTPFSYPYNEISLKREMTNDKYIIAITDQQNKLVFYEFTKSSDRKYQVDFNVLVPQFIKDLKFGLSSNVNMEEANKSLKLSLKSNLFDDVNLEMTARKNEYQIKLSNPSQEGQVHLKISQFQSSGKQIELVTQYGESRHTAEIVYEIQSVNEVYLKTVIKSSSFSSSSKGLEAHYKHKLIFPDNLNFDTQWKFNDRIVLYKSISWQRQIHNNFDFSWKMILSPNEKEYESKIDFSCKRGEIFDLIISSSKVLSEPINFRIIAKLDHVELSLRSPFQWGKQINVKVHTEQETGTWIQTITFMTNAWGKYEMVTKYQALERGNLLVSSQINTPSRQKKIFAEINLINQHIEQSLKARLDFEDSSYKLSFGRGAQILSMKLDTSLEYLKGVTFEMKDEMNRYDIRMVYNEHQANLVISRIRESLVLKIESNTKYFKVMSMSISKSKISELQKSLNVEIMKDNKYFKWNCDVNWEKSLFKYSSENYLFLFVPKSLEGRLQYSFDPIDLALELKSNDITFFHVILNKDQVLFNSQIKVYQTAIKEVKFSATNSKIEFILLSNDVFSVLITKTSKNQIDATAIIHGNQYSLRTIFENSENELNFKLSTYKNAVEKLLEINNQIGKKEKFVNFEVNYLSKTLLKWKVLNKHVPVRMISMETRLFSLDGVVDLIWDERLDLKNIKLSWNFLYYEQQLQIGSISYVWKSSKPLNYLMSVNLRDMAFQAQFLESDNGQYRFKISSPLKGFDIDLKWLLTHESNIYKLWWSLENSFTGEYSVKTTMRLYKDPEMKFLLSSTMPIINYKFNLITSVKNQVSFNTELRLFDWEKITLMGKLSTKDLIELIVALDTPFTMARKIHVEKRIKFISILQQTYDTTILYDGITKIKYVGKHEFHWEQKVFKFESSFHNEDIRIMSLAIDHSGSHDKLDHSFIWHFRDQKFGVKLNGGFNPLFEGKTEIFTPFHQAGKIVLVGRQMENGMLIEALKDNQELVSFEYMKEKDVRSIKVTPPREYGKSLGLRYEARRSKRSLGNVVKSEILYGTEKLIEVYSKVKMDKDKYSANFNLAAPKLTRKSVEISLNHESTDKTTNFDHKILLKDTVHQVYRLFGNLVRENSNKFQIALNSEHPEYGLMHLSLGHSLMDNSYDHQFLMKSGGETKLMHSGNFKFDFDKSSFEAELNTIINPIRHRLTASHSGDWKSFVQSLLLEHNEVPYLRYKSQIVQQEKSHIEIEFPTIDGNKIRITLDNKENKIECALKTKFTNHLLELKNKNGNLKMLYKANEKSISSLSIGYGAQPLYIKGSYLRDFGNVELSLENGFVTLKMTSSFTKLRTAVVKFSKNKIMAEVDYNGKPYTLKAEYNYSPDNAYVILETSIKPISRVEFHASPTKCKLILNDFFQTLQYIIKRDHVQLIGENNFLLLRTLNFDLKLEGSTKALLKLQLNSFRSESKFQYFEDKIIVENENNYFSIRSAEFKILSKTEKGLQYRSMIVSTNKIERLKLQFEIKNEHYSLGLDTYLGTHLVASYNQPLREMVISLKSNKHYLNIINKMREVSSTNSKTFVMETSVDSSLINLQRLKNEIRYTMTDSVYEVKVSTNYDERILVLRGEFSKSKIHIYFSNDKIVYMGTIMTSSANDLDLDVTIPGHRSIIRFRRDNDQYSCEIECNQKEILKVVIKQKTEFKESLKHESTISFRGRTIWNFYLNTDFRKYEIRMNKPTMISLTITNSWREREATSLGFLFKYDGSRKPIEIGAGIKFQLTNNRRFFEVHLENSKHLIAWKKETNGSGERQVMAKLVNKETKDHWESSLKWSGQNNFEMFCKTPKSTREIKYHEIIENNVRTSVDLNVFGSFKFNLKSNKNFPNLWTGSLTLYSIKMATIEMGKDYVKVIINEAAPEKERIFLKWTISSAGQWKKDYSSIKQLVLIQKALNINLDISQKTRMESKVYSTLTTINHQLMDGSKRTLRFGSSIDFSKPNTISLELDNPFLPIKTVLRRSYPDETSLRYEMDTIFNDDDKINGFFLLSTGSNPGITMRLSYNPKDPSQFVQMHSKYLDDRQMETHIFIEQNTKKTTYFQVLLRLLSERHVQTTFAWKTYTLSQLSETIDTYKNRLLGKVRNVLEHEIKLIRITERFQQFMRIIPNRHKLIVNLEELLNKMVTELQFLDWEITKMVAENEFYIRSISDAVFNTIHIGFRFADKVIRNIIPIIEKVQVKITGIIRAIYRFNCQIYGTAYGIIRYILNPIESIVRRYSYHIFEGLQINLKHSLYNLKNSLVWQYEKMIKVTFQIRRLFQSLFLNHSYKMVVKTLEFVRYISRKIHSFDFLEDEREVKIMYNKLIAKLEDLKEFLAGAMQSLMNYADDNVRFLTHERYFQMLGKVLSSAFDFMIEQLKDEYYQRIVKDFISSSIRDSFDEINSKIREVTIDLVWPYVDTSEGQRLYDDNDFKMVVGYKSPIPINDFKSLPDFGYVTRKINKIKLILRHIKQSWNRKSSWKQKFSDMKDWFAISFPAWPFPSILPEFENYATISKTSVATFDKQSFQLTSEACRILLSKDNQFKRWEIILNQRKDGRSYSINIGSNKFEISETDYKVQLNGQLVELPILIGSTSLIGLGRVMKLKDDKLGLTITVDPLNEMFTVGISGWYHGKVRGLFGNSDNEPFNDLMLDDGTIVTSNAFTKAFNYNGQSCGIVITTEKTVKAAKYCPFLRRVACKFLYKCPFSPMAACFKTVDPTNFLNMCTNSQERLVKLDPSICNSARQYQAQCSQAGIKIQLPIPCRKCDVSNNKPLSVNEFQDVKVKDKVSDIIFIVDKGDCLNSLKPRLSDVVSTLEKEMHAKGITSVKFGLVTYADDYIDQANFHTVGQRMLGSSEDLIKSLQALKQSNGKFNDVAGAILQAYNYPFREHASRHIVMISCRSVKELPVKLDTISDKLQQKAIHFSLLSDFTFNLKDSPVKTIIFGVDSKNIYTPLSRTGDKNLANRPTKDVLYKLTMKLKGVVFDYKYLTATKVLAQKGFINTFANQISQSAIPARSSRCTCVDDGEYNCVPLDTHTIFPITKVT